MKRFSMFLSFALFLFLIPPNGLASSMDPSQYIPDDEQEKEKEYENGEEDEERECKGYICSRAKVWPPTHHDKYGFAFPISIGVSFRAGDFGLRDYCEEWWQFEGDKTWKKVPDIRTTCEHMTIYAPKPGTYKFCYKVRCMDFATGTICEDIVCREIEVIDTYGNYEEAIRLPGEDERQNNSSSSFQLSPNPSKGNLNLEFDLNAVGPVDVLIFNNNGQVVHQELHSGQEGANAISLDLDGKVTPGFYTVQVSSGTKIFVARAVIQ